MRASAGIGAGRRGAPDRRLELIEGSPKWQYLDRADAIIFGSPTYMAGPSAAFKAFMDATSGRYAEQAWADKLAVGFTNLPA